jgi:hypothetical protein
MGTLDGRHPASEVYDKSTTRDARRIWGAYMTDKTTDGYEVTREEIAGMLRNLCAYALSEPEPLQRYIELTYQQVLFDGLVAAIRRERGRALADLAAAGVPVAAIAKHAKLATPQQVRSLVTAAGLKLPRARSTPRGTKSSTPAGTDEQPRRYRTTSPKSGGTASGKTVKRAAA